MQRRCSQARAQIRFFAIRCERDAVRRADIHARVAFDAELRCEYRLYIAVEATLSFGIPGRTIEPELHFDLDVAERQLLVLPRYLVTLLGRDRVVVAPLVDAHLR